MPFWLTLALSCVRGAEPCSPARPLPKGAGGSFQVSVDHLYVVDGTKSLNTKIKNRAGDVTRWGELQAKLLESISAIPVGEGHRLHLLIFGDFVPSPLQWNSPPSEITRLSRYGRGSAGFQFDLRNEAARERVLNLVRSNQPYVGHTALNDAIAAAFDRVEQLHAEAPDRQILMAVFSDGEDNRSRRYASKAELARREAEAKTRLGTSLVNEGYLFVRIAGMNVNPPTRAIIIDQTPTLATVSLGPQALEAGTLADREETEPVEVAFDIKGMSGRAFRVYFEPLPAGSSKPQVGVLCDSGADAAFAEPGIYRIRFRRQGPAADYGEAFEGLLKLDLGDYRYRTVDGTRLSCVSPPVQVRFAGMPKAELSRSEVKPADGTRVLVGNTLRFEAPPRAEADYRWVFSGVETGEAEGAVVKRKFQNEGRVDVEVRLRQPGMTPATVRLWVQVVDPKLRLVTNPSNPVEGEEVKVRLEHGSGITVRGTRWLQEPKSIEGPAAVYEYSKTGVYPVSASVTTDFGEALATGQLTIGPGIPVPRLTVPDVDEEGIVKIYNQEEPQSLEAEVGQGVEAAQFLVEQDGRREFTARGVAEVVDGHRVAKAQFAYPPSLQPGPASLSVVAIPQDASLAARLGERKSVYPVQVSRHSFSITRLEPLGFELIWNRPTSFVVALGGAGAKKLEGLEWKVELVSRSGSVPLPGSLQKPDAFQQEGDLTTASYELILVDKDPRLKALQQDSWLRVSAVPQGDARIIADQSAVWDALRPKLAEADFVVECPSQVSLDEQMKLSVVDRLNGNDPTAVRWEIVGEKSNPLDGITTPSVMLEPHRPGAHMVRADVTWAGGEASGVPSAFYVFFTPIDVKINWDGGRKPVLKERGERNRVTVLNVDGVARGSRAALLVDVKQLHDNVEGDSLAGWPKMVPVTDAADVKLLEVPWPEYSEGRKGESLVKINQVGYDVEGQYQTNRLDSFRIVNLPPIPPLPIIAVVSIALVLGYVIFRLTHGNEGRCFSMMSLSHRGELESTLAAPKLQNEDVPADSIIQWFDDDIRQAAGHAHRRAVHTRRREVAADWQTRSWWSKCVPIQLSDGYFLPNVPLQTETWPGWLHNFDGYLKLKRKDREYYLEGCVYQDVKLRDVEGETNVEEENIFAKPDICKQVLRLYRAGQDPVYLLLWDSSWGSDEARKVKWLKWVGRIALLLLAAGLVAVLQTMI